MFNVCSCLKKELFREYHKIKERHDKKLTKNDRLWSLAEPKTKVVPYCKSDNTATSSRSNISRIEIVSLEAPTNPRLEQLSLPRVRQLTALCEQKCFTKLSNNQKETVHRTLRKSFLSMYSRFSNVDNPFPEKSKVITLTPEERERHKARMNRLARPVKSKKSRESIKPPKEKPVLYRYKALSKPRINHSDRPPVEWHLTNKMLKYKVTPRLEKLARPVRRSHLFDHNSFNKSSQTFKPKQVSSRLLELSKPRHVFKHNTALNSSLVPLSALKAKASERILVLAKPRKYDGSYHIRKNPNKGSRRMLNAVASLRIQNMAKPRVHFD